MKAYLWQQEPRKPFYRLQTTDKRIADICKRRNKFRLSAEGINVKIWIFDCEFSRPDIAKKIFQSIIGQKPKIDSEGILFAES